MARIFLALAIFAACLLVGNGILAFLLGDFGAASRRYSTERKERDLLERASESPSAADIAVNRDRLKEATELLRDQRSQFWPHIWLGIAASLITLLVNSISITYFIGTNRWCREVADAYSMPARVVRKSQDLKRRSFLWSLSGISLILVTAGLGAAADPYATSADPAAWVPWHWMLALGGTLVILASFYAQYLLVSANHLVIEEVLADAQRIRADRAALLAEQATS